MCVSSQAGCGMACPFCATGQGGLQRNLSTAEIVDQVVDGARRLPRGRDPGGPGRVNNVVFMGMGEPLANYKAVIGAVRQLVTRPRTDSGCALGDHRVHGRTGAADAAAGHRGHPGHAGAVPARPRRRAARRTGAGQHPVERRRGGRRRVGLRRAHQAPGVHRVHPDPRHQRPGVAGRPAGPGAASARQLGLGARQPHPAEPDAGLQVDRVPAPRRATSSSAGSRPRACP